MPRMSGGLVTPRLFARKNSLRLVITDSMWKKNIPVMSAHAKRPRNLRTGRVLAWNVGGTKNIRECEFLGLNEQLQYQIKVRIIKC